MNQGPVLIDLEEDEAVVTVSDAAPVPDLDVPPPAGQAMITAARVAGRKPSGLARWFWGLLVVLIGAAVSLAAWDFATGLLERAPVLGWMITGLMAALILVLLIVAAKELAAFSRLGRIDTLSRAAKAALAADDLAQAREVTTRLVAFYRGREDTRWGRERLAERMGEQFDAAGLLGLSEDTLLAPLDQAALREVESAARQVATVTALVPIALADVVVALASSLRMIRRIAEIYGGRSGFFGSWRLTRAVFAHLLATGAVAVGDDMLEHVLGGSVLSKLSRRFGEGLVNGALSARVGVAAIEVCRPLPFVVHKRPAVGGVVRRALAGLFTSK